ncbi:MAG: HEAT repeat domain-containing protein [Acidobacteriota bacterium]
MRSTCCSAKLAALLILALLIPQPLLAQSRQSARQRKPHPQTQQIATAISELLKQNPLQPESSNDDADAAPEKDDAKEEKPPADDAPIKELIVYWRNHTFQDSADSKTKPSDKVRERLLAACEDRPNLLPRLMHALPQTSDAYDRIYKLMTEDPGENAAWKQVTSQWLKFNSSYFREDLIEEARGLSQNSAVDISPVNALARLDWDAVRPMVQTMANGANPYQATQALGMIYDRANRNGDTSQADSLRVQLQAMVTNRQTPIPIRQSAFQALMTTEWSGQEDWYVSLFNDTSLSGAQLGEKSGDKADEKTAPTRSKGELGRLTEDGVGFNFLWLPLQENATRWLPVVMRLVGNNDRAVHLAAVSSLAEFLAVDANAKEQSQQAARALLPWLTDPKWGGGLERWSYIGSLSKMNLPEAVPGLIWILDNDDEAESRAMAAEALIRYKNPQTIQPLRRAMGHEKDEQLREALIAALIQLGGFSDEEAASAIEEYARKAITTEGQKEIAEIAGGDSNKSLPLPVSIGRVYDQREEIEITESLAAKLFERAKALRATEPAVARQILAIAENADLIIADLNLIERISEGWIDVDAIKLALEGRASMRKRAGDELAKLFKQGGYAAGLAAILLDDEGNRLDVLKGKDQNAQLALLAAARYTREKLPVESVSKLFNAANPVLVAAAESYLEVEDSAEARKIVWARHPGEAKILGERVGAEAAMGGALPIGKWEEKMREEVRGAGGAEEIYAIVPNYNPGLFGSSIIRLRKGQAEIGLQYEEGRRRVRWLSAAELQDLKEFTSREEIENLGQQNRKTYGEVENDVMRFEYLRLTKDGGRRIMTPAPGPTPKKDATLHEQLAGLFYQLSHTGEFKLRYAMEDKIPGLEVLLANDKRRVFTACQEGGQLKLMIEPERADSAGTLGMNPTNRPPYSFEWRTLAAGQLGAAVEEPSSCQFHNPTINAPEWITEIRQRFGVMMDWRAKQEDAWYAPAVIEGEQGVWKFEENKSPVKIAEGTYVNLVVTPDGKWIVAKKIVQSTEKYEMQITRISLQPAKQAGPQTSREFAVGAAQLSAHYPITFVTAHNKVLLGQGHYQYGRELSGGVYYLLDAETGTLQQVKGEFRPLQDQFTRALQPTEKPNEFWAVVYDSQKKVTIVGRYDARAFIFAPVVEVPEIRVGSADVWVDAMAGKVYITYLGHLLRVPLAK